MRTPTGLNAESSGRPARKSGKKVLVKKMWKKLGHSARSGVLVTTLERDENVIQFNLPKAVRDAVEGKNAKGEGDVRWNYKTGEIVGLPGNVGKFKQAYISYLLDEDTGISLA